VNARAIPSLVGVIHLPALPGSPRYAGDLRAIADAAARDARVLAETGWDAVVIENFGDAPFEPRAVPPVTVAALTRCALAARDAAPKLGLGINVLRNDAMAALAVAVATDASFIRVNVHIGARVTDQGIVEGRAHETVRTRHALRVEGIALFCDVDVKHSAPLGARPLEEEAHDLVERAAADAILVTGTGTGRGASRADVERAVKATSAPVLVASGVTAESLAEVDAAHGVIVGSCLRADGRAGGPIDAGRASAFAKAWRARRAG
jgi:membrane complex biogenesis BtpA family protein